MMYQDKLGVYRVGDLKFYSKLEAIEMHTRTGIHPHWDFNEAVFSSYDWTVEPKENLLELYRRRAEQIRNKYDYIVLMFSGGADSTTVLESFLTNDIHIDEIASFQNYSVTGDHESFLSAEVTRVARPKIELLKEKYPWLKHRILDLGPMEIEYFSSAQGRNWLYEINSILCPSGVARESLGLKVKEWRDIIDSGKKFCILYGSDKPRVTHKNGRYVFNFVDSIDNTCTVKSMAGQQPYTDELFFWSPDLPEICIKQAHMVKTYLSQPNIETAAFITPEKTSVACTVKNGKTHWLTVHGVHRIVYPNWDITTFSVGKANDVMLTPRDEWLFNLSDTHTVKQSWEIGRKKLLQTLPDYWKNDLSNWAKGVKGCISKDYYLE
jgi:hypothetical protein